MSHRFKGVCNNCESAFVAKGGVALTTNSLEDFLRAAHVAIDSDAIVRFMGKLNDQISRNEVTAKRMQIENRDQQLQLQRSLRAGSISRSKMTAAQRRQSSIRVDSNETSLLLSDDLNGSYSPHSRKGNASEVRSLSERRYRLGPATEKKQPVPKAKKGTDPLPMFDAIDSIERPAPSPSSLRGRQSLSYAPGDEDQRPTPSLLSPKNVTIAPLPSHTKKGPASCLVPVSASTAQQVPLPLLVLLASVCDLLCYRNETSTVGGAANDPLTGPRQLWQACGGDPKGRKPISYSALRLKVQDLTGLDLGPSKRAVFGGRPLPATKVTLGDVLKGQQPRSMSTTLGPPSGGYLTPPATAPQDDCLEFSELEKYFAQSNLQRGDGAQDGGAQALQRAKAVMAAAHAKGSSTHYIPTEDEITAMNNAAGGGNAPGSPSTSVPRNNKRAPSSMLAGLKEEVDGLFIEDFYGDIALGQLEEELALAEGGMPSRHHNLNASPTMSLAQLQSAASFSSPTLQSSPSFGAFPDPTKTLPSESNPSATSPSKLVVTNAQAINNSIAATWDALAVLIGEPSVGGSANDPLDPKAHCLRRALVAFRTLVGSHPLGGNASQLRRRDSTNNPFLAVAAVVKFAHQAKPSDEQPTDSTQGRASMVLSPVKSRRSMVSDDTAKKAGATPSNGNVYLAGMAAVMGARQQQQPQQPQTRSNSRVESPIKATQVAPLPVIIRNGQRATAEVEALIQKLAAVDQLDASASSYGGKGLLLPVDEPRRKAKKVQANDKDQSPLKARMEKLRVLAASHGLVINEGQQQTRNASKTHIKLPGGMANSSSTLLSPKKESCDASTQTDKIRKPKAAKLMAAAHQLAADDELAPPPAF